MANRFKGLAIISDCVHMKDEQGNVVTENHIYCRQMQSLASRFKHTVIVCPFADYTKESVTSVYTLPSLDFIAVPNVGGNRIRDKLNLIKTIPTWIKAFRKARKVSGIIYLRMPNNLNIPGFFYFMIKRSPSFATYTGTWSNYKHEPVTYRFQKWLLKNFFRGPVWVYTKEAPGKKNLFKGYSPSYSDAEWSEESIQVAERICRYNSAQLATPVFITVGALVPNKNQQYILETCRKLRDNGFSFYWHIVGDGYMKSSYETFIKEHGLHDYVRIAGKKTAGELKCLYREANFLVQATLVEGFGKTPIEAMFHGVIPILSKTAMAGEMTGNGTRGYIFDARDENSLFDVIMKANGERHAFPAMINNGREYVKKQTLESWTGDMLQQLELFYNTDDETD